MANLVFLRCYFSIIQLLVQNSFNCPEIVCKFIPYYKFLSLSLHILSYCHRYDVIVSPLQAFDILCSISSPCPEFHERYPLARISSYILLMLLKFHRHQFIFSITNIPFPLPINFTLISLWIRKEQLSSQLQFRVFKQSHELLLHSKRKKIALISLTKRSSANCPNYPAIYWKFTVPYFPKSQINIDWYIQRF